MTESVVPVEVNQQFVLTKCEYFVDVQLWPALRTKVDPERWLSNFGEGERDHAIHLLNGFLYFSQGLMESMFYSSLQALSMIVRGERDTFRASQAAWRAFLDNTIVTRVTGEVPSDADSGFSFQRMARDVWGFPESRIGAPEEILRALLERRPRTVIFVDDFAGSGNQFVATWQRSVAVPGFPDASFSSVADTVRGNRFFYCPLVCTEYARQRIRTTCPEVVIAPAHFLSEKYSILSSESVIWPSRLLPSARDFVDRASERAGIPSTERYGFHDLGLAIAFHHCVPDASVPLLSWNQNGWRPLVERRPHAAAS